MRKTRRADGQVQLMRTAQDLERCYTRSATYVGCAAVTLPVDSLEQHYSIDFVGAATASAFTLTAVPQGDQANDTDCAELRLTDDGTQGSTGTADPRACW